VRERRKTFYWGEKVKVKGGGEKTKGTWFTGSTKFFFTQEREKSFFTQEGEKPIGQKNVVLTKKKAFQFGEFVRGNCI